MVAFTFSCGYTLLCMFLATHADHTTLAILMGWIYCFGVLVLYVGSNVPALTLYFSSGMELAFLFTYTRTSLYGGRGDHGDLICFYFLLSALFCELSALLFRVARGAGGAGSGSRTERCSIPPHPPLLLSRARLGIAPLAMWPTLPGPRSSLLRLRCACTVR